MIHASPRTARDALSYRIQGINLAIDCAADGTGALLRALYRTMESGLDAADVRYTVARPNGSLVVSRTGTRTSAADPGDVLLTLDQDLIVQIQRRRRDLYFLHAGVLEF